MGKLKIYFLTWSRSFNAFYYACYSGNCFHINWWTWTRNNH